MTEPPRRLSRLGGSKGGFSLHKTTPNVAAVRKKRSPGKIDLLPAVPIVLKDKKRKTVSDNQGKLKKLQKARVSFVPPTEFRLSKQKTSTAVMPISRQTPEQLQLAEQALTDAESNPEPKLDVDFRYSPLQLPFKASHTRSPLLSALSPLLPSLTVPNIPWPDFALDGPQLASRARSLPILPRGLGGNKQARSQPEEQLLLGCESVIDAKSMAGPPPLCPLLESCPELVLSPPITRQNTVPLPVPRNGYIKQETGLAKLLFRSDSLDSEHNSSLMFVQLPTTLPIVTPHTLGLVKGTDKQILAQKISELDKNTEGISLKRIPPGFLGNITLFKSGKMTLQLGGVALNAETGTRKTFREEVMAMSSESGECFSLGSISSRLVFGLDVGVT